MIDKSDYYPNVPGASCDPDADNNLGATASDNTPLPRAGSATENTDRPEPQESRPATDSHNDHDSKDSEDYPVITRLCNIISWILVPLLVPVYATIMILQLTPLAFLPTGTKVIFTAVVLLFSAIIPMGLVFVLKQLGMVDDIGLNGRKERLIPYIITIVSLGGVALFFHYKGAPAWMSMFYAGGALAALINMTVNFRWKISAHAAGMAGVVAMLIWLAGNYMPHVELQWWIMATTLLTGLLGSARVWLGRHTVAQVMCGYAVGFLSVYLPLLIF